MWITFNLALIIHANASQNTLFREKSPNQICFFVQLMACFMKIYCRFVITVLYLINDIISLEVGWDIISAAVLTIMAVNPPIYQPKSQFFNVSDHSRVLIHLLNTCICTCNGSFDFYSSENIWYLVNRRYVSTYGKFCSLLMTAEKDLNYSLPQKLW